MAYSRLGKEDGDKLRQNIPVHNLIALHLKEPAAHVSATKRKKMRVGAKRPEQRGGRGGGGREGEGKVKGGERQRGRESCRQGLEAAIPDCCNYPDDIIGHQRRLIIIRPQDTFSL